MRKMRIGRLGAPPTSVILAKRSRLREALCAQCLYAESRLDASTGRPVRFVPLIAKLHRNDNVPTRANRSRTRSAESAVAARPRNRARRMEGDERGGR